MSAARLTCYESSEAGYLTKTRRVEEGFLEKEMGYEVQGHGIPAEQHGSKVTLGSQGLSIKAL